MIAQRNWLQRAIVLVFFAFAWCAGPGLARAQDEAPPAAAATSQSPAAEAAPSAPSDVHVGVFINDINSIDLRNYSFVMDFYVWFRWSDPNLDPAATFEIMNLGDPDYQNRGEVYRDAELQPDGRYYQVLRYQGAFLTKFPIEDYPFDTQVLQLHMEDSESNAEALRYVVDELVVNPAITLPGYQIVSADLTVAERPYTTAFGDLNIGDVESYSRASLRVAVNRPWLAGAVKTLLPVVLIFLCAAAALLLGAQHVEARIGLAITSLLALVALQFSMIGSLPEVGYLLMLDQIYVASYLFVLIAIAVIVHENYLADRAEAQGVAFEAKSVLATTAAIALYAGALAGIIWFNLVRGA